MSSSLTKQKYSFYSPHHEILLTEGLNHVCKMVARQSGQLSPRRVILSMKAVRQLLIPPELSHVQAPPYRDSMNSESFLQFCDATVHLLKSMSPSQLNDFFSLCLRYSLPMESKIFSQLISTIHSKLYGFNHYDLCRLDVLLKALSRYDANIDVSMIRLSIPVYFNKKPFTHSPENYSIIELVMMSEFTFYSGAGVKPINAILTALYERRKEVPERLLFRTLASLLGLEFLHKFSSEHSDIDNEKRIYLIKFFMNKMVDTNCDQEIRRLMETRLLPRDIEWIDDKFLEYTTHLYEEIFSTLDVSSMGRVLDNFRRSSYIIPSLLREYDRVIRENPEKTVENMEPVSMIANLASLEQFKPSLTWDEIKELVLKQFRLKKSSLKLCGLCKLAVQFAFLNEYPAEVYREFIDRAEKDPKYLFSNLTLVNIHQLLNVNVGLTSSEQLSYECIRFKELLEPHIGRFIEQLDVRIKEKERDSQLNCELLSLLRIPNGGDDYVQELAWTRDGIQIHNLLLMREGNYPMKFAPQKGIVYLEDIKQPIGSTPLSVLPLDKYTTTKDNLILKSCEFHRNMMEKRGIKVVLVNLKHLSSLNQYEKIPFLMSQISSKLNETSK